jgi:hypothetical protein
MRVYDSRLLCAEPHDVALKGMPLGANRDLDPFEKSYMSQFLFW